jgi:hypothetical protein
VVLQRSDWNRNIEKGKELLIQGLYKSKASSVVLVLNGFNTILDSLLFRQKCRKASFRLHTIPKQNGKAVYTLSVLQGKDTLEKEPYL